MKKILLAIIAAAMAVTITACGSPAQIKKTGEAEKMNIENMTAEKAAGKYLLDFVNVGSKENIIEKDSYEYNYIKLSENGLFEFAAKSGDTKEEFSGTYTISENGLLTLGTENTEFFITAKNEIIYCDGEIILAEGDLGKDVIASMKYLREGSEAENSDNSDNTDNAENTDNSDNQDNSNNSEDSENLDSDNDSDSDSN